MAGLPVDADAYSSDGKKIGKVQRIDADHFIVYKKGVLTDEEYQIPTGAVLADQPPVKVSLSEEQLKHAYKYLQGRPNSEFMHGRAESEPKFSLEKQVIHYESPVPADKGKIAEGTSSPPVSRKHQAVFTDGGKTDNYYSCDMCQAKFDKEDALQKHRADSHMAPTNI